MKKLLLFIFLILCPSSTFALTQVTGLYYNNGGQAYLDNNTNSIDFINYWRNTDFPLGGYYQTQVWFDNYGGSSCGNMYGPIALNGADNETDTFSLAGHSSITQVYRLTSDSNSLDGNGCLDTNINEYDELGGSPELFIIGLPVTGGGGSATSSTATVVDNPVLDWFLGFIIFCICMIFPIWLFRKRS